MRNSIQKSWENNVNKLKCLRGTLVRLTCWVYHFDWITNPINTDPPVCGANTRSARPNTTCSFSRKLLQFQKRSLNCAGRVFSLRRGRVWCGSCLSSCCCICSFTSFPFVFPLLVLFLLGLCMVALVGFGLLFRCAFGLVIVICLGYA